MRATRGQDGFGLIELLIAMVILNVGILAIVAAFNSGIVSLARSSHIATATALADQQMELYRGLTYSCIYLSSGTIPGSGSRYATAGAAPPAGDGFYNATQITTPCSAPDAIATNAQRIISGPDHHLYEIDTYIVACAAASCAPAGARAEILVSVAVRDKNSALTWARQQSKFDQSTGS